MGGGGGFLGTGLGDNGGTSLSDLISHGPDQTNKRITDYILEEQQKMIGNKSSDGSASNSTKSIIPPTPVQKGSLGKPANNMESDFLGR